MSEKHSKLRRALNNYIEHFLAFVSAVSGCVSIFAFVSWISVTLGIARSAAGLKICALTAGNKKYQSVIKKKRKKHDNIVLFQKTKSNTIEYLVSKVLTSSYNNHDEFV